MSNNNKETLSSDSPEGKGVDKGGGGGGMGQGGREGVVWDS